MVNMGYSRQSIEDSVTQQKFDDIQATYLLLGRRTTDVMSFTFWRTVWCPTTLKENASENIVGEKGKKKIIWAT